MESQPQNPEFRNNPENFHPCFKKQAFLPAKTCNIKVNQSTSVKNIFLKFYKYKECVMLYLKVHYLLGNIFCMIFLVC